MDDVEDGLHRADRPHELRREADEIQLHLAFYLMYLQNVARQYRRNLVVADMVVLQVDRRLDIPLAAKDEDFRLDAARKVGIEAQNLGIQQLPGDDILRQVYFGDFVFHY